MDQSKAYSVSGVYSIIKAPVLTFYLFVIVFLASNLFSHELLCFLVATEQEFAEALGVAIQMNGGPGTVYAPKAWDAYKEFKERYG